MEKLDKRFKRLINKKRLKSLTYLKEGSNNDPQSRVDALRKRLNNKINDDNDDDYESYLKEISSNDPQSRVDALRKRLNNKINDDNDDSNDDYDSDDD